VLSGEKIPLFLYAIIYIMIPFGSIGFVVMVQTMTPEM
jgi:flagellar protein FlaJ